MLVVLVVVVVVTAVPLAAALPDVVVVVGAARFDFAVVQLIGKAAEQKAWAMGYLLRNWH